MKRIVIAILSILVLATGVTACRKSVPGEDEVSRLRSIVLDAGGNIAFDRTLVNGPYHIGVDSREDAARLASLYVGDGFTGEEFTYTLPGDKGAVNIYIECTDLG